MTKKVAVFIEDESTYKILKAWLNLPCPNMFELFCTSAFKNLKQKIQTEKTCGVIIITSKDTKKIKEILNKLHVTFVKLSPTASTQIISNKIENIYLTQTNNFT